VSEAGIDLDDFDFALPRGQIAQQPLVERDASRLLCLNRESGEVRHETIRALPQILRPGDLLVVNATRVVPARLIGRRESGGAAEALLLGPQPGGGSHFRALVKVSGRLRPGIKLHFTGSGKQDVAGLDAEITELHEEGQVTLSFADGASPYTIGRPPLPPYIERAREQEGDRERYQTVFAKVPGAIAAPTAGLHLSDRLLAEIEAAGVRRAEVVLHVGIGTFRPLREADLREGRLHPERFELPDETARAIAETRAAGGRIVAVGTTATRVLETQARDDGTVEAGSGETRLFIRPGDRFRVVDALLTNFHLPRSSLLLLVAAFAGREHVLAAYETAVTRGYRFFSYGDAMWIA
jgi:S-adenosylmethionine:tRNA ribosyltransferase-isomerase